MYLCIYCFVLFCTVLFYTGSPKCLPLGNLSLLAKISVIRLHTLGSTLARHHANLSNWIKGKPDWLGKVCPIDLLSLSFVGIGKSPGILADEEAL
jgi:hypothetical protein